MPRRSYLIASAVVVLLLALLIVRPWGLFGQPESGR